mgnify:CR=1 FL=1
MASITPINDGYEIEVLDTGSFTLNVKQEKQNYITFNHGGLCKESSFKKTDSSYF